MFDVRGGKKELVGDKPCSRKMVHLRARTMFLLKRRSVLTSNASAWCGPVIPDNPGRESRFEVRNGVAQHGLSSEDKTTYPLMNLEVHHFVFELHEWVVMAPEHVPVGHM